MLGAMTDVGVTFPRRSRVFLEGRGQYRWIPRTVVGPFTSVVFGSTATLRPFEIDISHAVLTLRLGARF